MSGAVPHGAPPPPTGLTQAGVGPMGTLVARVLEVAAEGALIAAGRSRWLAVLPQNAPALRAGSTIRLAIAGLRAAPDPAARLLAIGGRTLDPQLPIELRPAPGSACAPPPSRSDGGQAASAAHRRLPSPALHGALDGAELPRPDSNLAARLMQLLHLIEAAGEAPGGARKPNPGFSLAGTLAELAREAREPLSGGWRLYLLPFGTEQDMQELRLWLREDERRPPPRERKERAPAPEDAPYRAVFEVELSRLGRCQIDVLCRAGGFNVLLRTAAPLEVASRHEIAAIFEAARAAGGLNGRIDFRSGALVSLAEPRSSGARGITV